MNVLVALPIKDVPKGIDSVTFWCHTPAESEAAARRLVARGTMQDMPIYTRGTCNDDLTHPDSWCVVRRDDLPEDHPEHRAVIAGEKGTAIAGYHGLRQAAMKFNLGGPPRILKPVDLTIYAGECSDEQLLEGYTQSQREGTKIGFMPDQRARASEAWSAALRAKVAASSAAEKERERLKVVCDREDDGE